MLILNNIEVMFDKVILILKGVSFEVPSVQIVALLGANGAGKTTTSETTGEQPCKLGIMNLIWSWQDREAAV